MADALLTAVATSILDSINSLWLQEFGISGSLKTELERLQSTLTTIQAVLLDAEEKQWKSEAIKNWLRKLKDVAYEVDDILDEFATNTHRGRLQRDAGNLKLPKVNSLRSLIVQDDFYLKIATKQKHLRALEVRDYQAMKISIDNFRHVRYLNLTDSDVQIVPESISSLRNLQTLNLRYCHRLQMLPEGLSDLKNLIYVDITECYALTCMPAGLGKLLSLRTLSRFIVGKRRGCYIDELKGLALEGELCIEDLDNVKSSRDARSANLKMKQNLRSVSLAWRENNSGDQHENAEDVLNGLQPHSSLKKLSIRNYHGPRFSYWLMNLLVPNLIEISLENCGSCECLPPLGKLHFLKKLSINGMDALKFIDSSFYGDGEISFPSLEWLCFSDMLCLEEWTTVNGKETFPLLTSLTIGYCPMLVELPMLPSLKRLEVEEASVSLLSSVMHFTFLTSLKIGDHTGELTVLPDGLLRNYKQLEDLTICAINLKSLSNVLDNLSALRRLDLQICHDLESLPAGLESLSCLESLHLSKCDSLISLPANGLCGLSSLSSLWIQNCEKLESLSNGVRYLTSLKDLLIDVCPELKSLPDSIQHLSALRSLRILGCEGLTCLPNQIQHLSSLSLLEIWECPNLMALPRGLQSLMALTELRIGKCSHLERRCIKEIGEDWPFIAHIPCTTIKSYEEYSEGRGSSGSLLTR
ncbi:hypothetical protein COLO4_27159 [Corchorus olitorius]|uniref:Uncharacterized protein n=1 Tax=Corchorus olitorius TaxID=93759 RepID=A0A1R3HSD1_9ROSI|nr:hypothetical protein COLO4_27159 [Corchorus olitorius]